jgi:uncharacterized protein YbjT (DUF2867 family)
LDSWCAKAHLLFVANGGRRKKITMKVLVMGSTGGSGRAAIEHLLAQGHEITAFARREGPPSERLAWFVGDAMNEADVDRAVRGHDAVVVALGISENPLRVRFFGPAHTPMDVRSVGTRNVIAAMRRHGVKRLVVQTTYGVGETRDRLGLVDTLFFELLLKPQIADSEKQETMVSESGLDWVLAQPVHLTDEAANDMPFVSTDGSTGKMKVSRSSIGRFLAQAVTSSAWVGKSVALSGAA